MVLGLVLVLQPTMVLVLVLVPGSGPAWFGPGPNQVLVLVWVLAGLVTKQNHGRQERTRVRIRPGAEPWSWFSNQPWCWSWSWFSNPNQDLGQDQDDTSQNHGQTGPEPGQIRTMVLVLFDHIWPGGFVFAGVVWPCTAVLVVSGSYSGRVPVSFQHRAGPGINCHRFPDDQPTEQSKLGYFMVFKVTNVRADFQGLQ